MSAYVKITRPSLRKLSPQQRGRILVEVAAGNYRAAIARKVGCAASTVSIVAAQAGLVVVAAPPRGRRFEAAAVARDEKSRAAVGPVEQTLQKHYAGLKANARWGAGMGG